MFLATKDGKHMETIVEKSMAIPESYLLEVPIPYIFGLFLRPM